MSAAFNTIDHDVIIQRLQHTFGIHGMALHWIWSYLTDRRSYVRWGSGRTITSPTDVGVPQGSSLGPLLVSLYVAPLANVTNSFGSRHHPYADDTYLYVFTSKEELTTGIQTIKRCASALYAWLSHNGLALNLFKLEAIQFSVAQGLHTNKVTAVNVADATIAPSPTIKSLGVVLDAHLKFDDHVVAVARLATFTSEPCATSEHLYLTTSHA